MEHAEAVAQTRRTNAATTNTALQRRNSEQRDIFLYLMAQANNLLLQVATKALSAKLPIDKLVISIEHDKERIQNANRTSANVSVLSSREAGKIVNGGADGSVIVTVTNDRYNASVEC